MWQEIIRHHRDKLNHSINQYTVKSLLWQLLNGLSYLHRSEQLLNLNLARVFFFFFVFLLYIDLIFCLLFFIVA